MVGNSFQTPFLYFCIRSPRDTICPSTTSCINVRVHILNINVKVLWVFTLTFNQLLYFIYFTNLLSLFTWSQEFLSQQPLHENSSSYSYSCYMDMITSISKSCHLITWQYNCNVTTTSPFNLSFHKKYAKIESASTMVSIARQCTHHINGSCSTEIRLGDHKIRKDPCEYYVVNGSYCNDIRHRTIRTECYIQTSNFAHETGHHATPCGSRLLIIPCYGSPFQITGHLRGKSILCWSTRFGMRQYWETLMVYLLLNNLPPDNNRVVSDFRH